MAFYQVDTSNENIKDYSGSNSYLNKSGMYDIVIKYVTVEVSPKGSEYLNFVVEHDGITQVIYNAIRLTNNDGKANLGQKNFNKLCVIAGMTNGATINDPETMMLPIGKNNEEKECRVLTEFCDLPVTIRLQMEYSLYNGNIMQNRNIQNYFRYTDKATASEIINDSDTKGKQYELESGYADRTIYKDGLTEDDIQEWIKSKKNPNTNTTTEKKSTNTGFTRRFGRK